MFSRDSHSSRNHKPSHSSSMREERLAHRNRTHYRKALYRKSMSAESPSETLGNKVGAQLGEKLKGELGVERSQSWQIAPNLFTSFKYAWAGISYAFKTQRNFRVHTGVGILAMILCWILNVSNLEIAVICLTIGAVLVMEILNTALESLVDLTVGQTYHQLAKVAKDCAAGAVLMAAIVALLIAALIFAPPLWTNLQNTLH